MSVAIVDVGLGNMHSVERALRAAGAADVSITRDPEAVARADRLVVPGQGAFRDCSRALANGLGEAVRERVSAGTPYLGICLGLQVLFARSDEAPGSPGLGIFPGEVRRIEGGIDSLTGASLKVPHVGWNEVDWSDGAAPEHFYFVHSFCVVPEDPSLIKATTSYGADFVSVVARDNVLAVQFHPEKSQRAGLSLLRRFVGA